MKALDSGKPICVYMYENAEVTHFEYSIYGFKLLIEKDVCFLAIENLSPYLLFTRSTIQYILSNKITPIVNNNLRFFI